MLIIFFPNFTVDIYATLTLLTNGNWKVPDGMAFRGLLFIPIFTQIDDLVSVISVFVTESENVWTTKDSQSLTRL